MSCAKGLRRDPPSSFCRLDGTLPLDTDHSLRKNTLLGRVIVKKKVVELNLCVSSATALLPHLRRDGDVRGTGCLQSIIPIPLPGFPAFTNETRSHALA